MLQVNESQDLGSKKGFLLDLQQLKYSNWKYVLEVAPMKHLIHLQGFEDFWQEMYFHPLKIHYQEEFDQVF